MTRRTKFEIMRERRTAKPKVRSLIDDIETDVDREWAKRQRVLTEERQQRFDNTADWLCDTRAQAREIAKTEPEPSLWRVLLVMALRVPQRIRRAARRRWRFA